MQSRPEIAALLRRSQQQKVANFPPFGDFSPPPTLAGWVPRRLLCYHCVFSCTIKFFPARKVGGESLWPRNALFSNFGEITFKHFKSTPKTPQNFTIVAFFPTVSRRGKSSVVFPRKKHFFSSNYATDDVGERIGE